MQWELGVDFGETGVRLATLKKGVALCSPSWGALRGEDLIAIGDAALQMLVKVLAAYDLFAVNNTVGRKFPKWNW